MEADQKRYLELLARSFPTQELAAAEIINLSAILNLPKGTEFFCSDIHGESEAFSAHPAQRLGLHPPEGGRRVRRSRCTDAQKRALATLIYYPREKAKLALSRAWKTSAPGTPPWCRAWWRCASVRRASTRQAAMRKRRCPAEFAYIIEELMNEDQPRRGQGSVL